MAKRAYSVSDILNKKYKVIPFEGEWGAAFSQPESNGSWFIWANSGNGKTTFVLKLCKELSKHERILYNSLEEGSAKTMQNAFLNAGLASVKRRLILVQESIEELCGRLDRPKSQNVIVLDSFQYTGLSFERYRDLVRRYPKKLFIIISQADGKQPSGRTAKRVMYDASLKIWVEGYRAFSKGRYIGPLGYYTIWERGAKEYHGM
ncbi:hypothetical protein ACF3OC_07855 [Sphingobacterium cellulitidis]|uniref:hypothetical protein n=1 Tax=Sphingobacterium cellulitidis TaxID=1768011 RepID=UPI00370DCF7F